MGEGDGVASEREIFRMLPCSGPAWSGCACARGPPVGLSLSLRGREMPAALRTAVLELALRRGI